MLDIAAIDKLGFGYYSVIYGFIFLGLGLAFRFKKSLTSTVVMALMMVLELVYYIIAISHNDINYIIEKNLNGIITRILLIATFVKGGIYRIRYKKENSTTQTNIAKKYIAMYVDCESFVTCNTNESRKIKTWPGKQLSLAR